MKKLSRVFALLMLFAVVLSTASLTAVASAEDAPFSGSGSVDDPYLISSLDDLVSFRDLVDGGNEFTDEYFLQTVDIDLALAENTKLWDPIGDWDADHYFHGIYNGGGHTISNLYTDSDFSGLFTRLGGTLMNLGIESGSINGNYVGAIASHANGPSSKIINCYSFANVNGIRAGGIADNFTAGIIADTFCAGNISGTDSSYGIVSYSASALSNCVYVGELPAVPTGLGAPSYKVSQAAPSESVINELLEQFKNNVMVNVSPQKQLLKGAKGEGDKDDPIKIATLEEFEGFATAVNLGHSFSGLWIKQTADIDLRGVEFYPIGNQSFSFDGIYDGGGHKISNLYIKDTSNNHPIALFGSISRVIMNLDLECGYVEGRSAAGIVGESRGSFAMLINCHNGADIVGHDSAGGLANSFGGGLIVNCLNTGGVSSNNVSGGVVAKSVNRMLNSFSIGSPVHHSSTSGVIISSCRQLNSVKEASELLNDALYDAATFTNYQSNNLVKWNGNGTLSQEYHNYFLPYLARFISVALALTVLLSLILLVYKTCKRGVALKPCALMDTVSISKSQWKTNANERIPFIIGAGFILSGILILAAYITGNNLITKDFGFSSAALYDFIVPMHSALNDNCADNGYYTIIGETYPPIARLVLFAIGKMMPAENHYISVSQMQDGYAVFVVVIYLVACLALIYYGCSKLNKNKYTVLSVFAVISSPMLFMIDRGNILLLVVALSALFVAGYRSENSVIRHLSYLCLAFAAAIKLYPVVLGLLVLKEKKWKHTLQCVVYGVIVCVLPFLFLGIDEILLYIRNVSQSFEDNIQDIKEWLVDYKHIFQSWFHKLFGNASLGETVGTLTLYPYTALLVACAFLTKERWKAVTAVMMIQILFPGFTVFYCMALLAIPMIMFANAEHHRKLDYVYALLFLFTLVPLQFLGGAIGLDKRDIWFIGGNACFALSILLIADCAAETVKRIKTKVSSKNTKQPQIK